MTVFTNTRELARIRSEYGRRAREIPEDFYGWNRPVNVFFHIQTVRACMTAFVTEGVLPLETRKIADIGCGAGTWLMEFLKWGARHTNLAGIDLSEGRVRRACEALPDADIRCGDASTLPWQDKSFDVVSQFTLFTSILSPSVKQEVASEMLRVLKPGGFILWYDFRYDNPRNPNVRGVESKEIRGLFPGCEVKLKRVTLAPPLARAVVPISWVAGLLLEKLPLLRTHYLGVVRKQTD
jgi:SAM-dependent methyltransferase